jgi:hypothetical protein
MIGERLSFLSRFAAGEKDTLLLFMPPFLGGDRDRERDRDLDLDE